MAMSMYYNFGDLSVQIVKIIKSIEQVKSVQNFQLKFYRVNENLFLGIFFHDDFSW